MKKAYDKRIVRAGGSAGSILVLSICILLLLSSTLAQTRSIKEEKFVSIGGIDQWVTINGSDDTKPVILFLHGGPGSVMSAYGNAANAEWKKDFILVNWDQRGAGKTFGHNAPADADEDYWIQNPLTISQMASDAIELSEYLLKRLGKKKIIIIGTSWGSVLGATTALKRPDLYYAYIGHAQMVNALRSLRNAYNKVYQLSQAANDQASIDKLKSLGAPPYDDARSAGQLFRIIKKYEKEHSVPAPAAWWNLAPEYDNATDNKHREAGDDYSFINFVGHKKLGIIPMMPNVDFMRGGFNFKIPVYLIQGEKDILTPKEITKEYFDKIIAPAKEYFLLPDAAHGYNQSVIDTQYKILKEQIRQLIPKEHFAMNSQQMAVTADTLKHILDAFNRHDLNAIMEFFADNCTFEMPRGTEPWGQRYTGKEQVRNALAGRFKGIPDVHYGDDRHWVAGDKGVSEWTLTGTTTAGIRVKVRGCDLWEFRNGKVVRKDSYWKIVE